MSDVRLHPHARDRAAERGASEAEIREAIRRGDPTPARHGRTQFRLYVEGPCQWRDASFQGKVVEVYAAPEGVGWLVITVIVRFVGRVAP